MNCLCICLSPAIDATVSLSQWPSDGCVIKDAREVRVPGGKALNVARWLALRGATVACGGIIGRGNSAVFESELAKYGIADRFVRVDGLTRTNEMFVTPNGSFKVNRPAEWNVSPQEVDVFAGGLDGFDTVVLSGSLPLSWPIDAYRELVERVRRAGVRAVLDTSGAALKEGVKAHPEVIKPNAEECEELLGFVPHSPEEFCRATAELRRMCGYPIVSDGAAGCWFDGEFVASPEVKVLDTTAAGDTLLAEWCFSGNPRLAVAAGSAACTMPGGEPPPIELVEEILK